MPNTASIDMVVIQEWLTARLPKETIEKDLLAQGLDNDAVEAHLAAYRKLRNARRQVTGFTYLAIGAVLGFISCVLTVTDIFPAMFNVILYGLTSVAVCLICIGLYFVFE